MSTPAVSRNEQGRGPTQTIRVFSSGPPIPGPVNPTGIITSLDQEIRPASSTVPFQDGWRNCKSWSHSGTLQFFRQPVSEYHDLIPGVPGWSGERYLGGGFWNLIPASLPSIPNGLWAEAEIKALNNLKDQKIHLGNFLAEAQKSINMVSGRASQIARQVMKFRKLHPRLWNAVTRWETGNLPKDLWGCIPDLWLELQYGWIPFMSDIFGALSALNALPRLPLVRVRGSSRRTINEKFVGTARVGSSQYTRYVKGDHKCFVSLWYSMRNVSLAELSSLGLINPAEIIWELTRYSFVVDWFLPIGSWLSALTGDVGYDFKSGSRSTISKAAVSITSVRWQNTPTRIAFGDSPSQSGSLYSFQRTCYLGSPVPGLYVKSPLSTQHLLNSLALLAQAFK